MASTCQLNSPHPTAPALAVGLASLLFANPDPLTLELTAPFNELFEHARAEDSYSVTGTPTITGDGHKATLEGLTIKVRAIPAGAKTSARFPS